MTDIHKLYSSENEVFRSYLYYVALVFLKMGVVALLTSLKRMQKQVFANQEDTKLSSKGKINFQDQDVERIRRIHLNDMENVYVFAIVGMLYITTDPSVFLATTLYKVFAYSRIVHTIVYYFAIPQPSRALAFLVGFLINIFMAVSILRFAL